MLAGRIALVTGGGSGIGRAVCQVFAKEGAAVTAVDRSKNAVMETIQIINDESGNVKKGQHIAIQADISSSKEVESMVQELVSFFRAPATIAVNCAGITRDNFILKLDEKSFDEVIDVNLKGTFLVTQAVAKMMVEHMVEGGSIVNLASIVGKVGNLGQCNYAASKAGVVGLTKTVAKELARNNIRCNAILPGFIETPMTDSVPEKVIEQMKSIIPAKRMGKPEEVAELCAFLASDRSSYITGAAIEITGGLFL